MKVIIKQPDQVPVLQEIPNTLEALQKEVGGYIETVRIATELVAIVDEEGKLKGQPRNILGLVGTIVFVGIKGTEFTDIPDSAERLFFGGRNPCIHCGQEVTEGHVECSACESEARWG